MNEKLRAFLVVCAALWAFFVTLPMWLVLIYQLLAAAGVPPWVWSLFWCYVPATYIASMMAAVSKAIEAE